MIDDIDTLAALAREAAFQHGDAHSYTPKSSAEVQTWTPHQWVIEAMRAAIRLNATPPPSPDAAVREAHNALVRSTISMGRVVNNVADRIQRLIQGRHDDETFTADVRYMREIVMELIGMGGPAPQRDPEKEAFPSPLAKALDNVLAIADEALRKIPVGDDEPYQSWLASSKADLKKHAKTLEDYLG